jgi:hypothetical protein
MSLPANSGTDPSYLIEQRHLIGYTVRSSPLGHGIALASILLHSSHLHGNPLSQAFFFLFFSKRAIFFYQMEGLLLFLSSFFYSLVDLRRLSRVWIEFD